MRFLKTADDFTTAKFQGQLPAPPVVETIQRVAIAALMLVFALHCQTAPAADEIAIWDGSTGAWDDASRWSTTAYPDNGNGGVGTYDAVVNGGSVDVNLSVTIEKFDLTGGSLLGMSMLTANDILTWTGGTMTGAGITQADGGIQMSGTTKSLNAGRILNNAGSATWSEGNINSGGGGTLENQATGSFTVDATSDLSFSYNQGGARSQFNNAGTFHKNGGSAASFSAEFNNTGTANVNDGELTLSGGGLSTGSFIVASPAKLRFNGGTYDLDIASSISGAGTVEMSSGTVNLGGNYSLTGTTAISNGTANFNSAGNTILLTISGGILGGSGTLTASGPLTWTGGTMTGAGITQADGGIQMSGTTKSLNAGRILNNVGLRDVVGGQHQ